MVEDAFTIEDKFTMVFGGLSFRRRKTPRRLRAQKMQPLAPRLARSCRDEVRY